MKTELVYGKKNLSKGSEIQFSNSNKNTQTLRFPTVDHYSESRKSSLKKVNSRANNLTQKSHQSSFGDTKMGFDNRKMANTASTFNSNPIKESQKSTAVNTKTNNFYNKDYDGKKLTFKSSNVVKSLVTKAIASNNFTTKEGSYNDLNQTQNEKANIVTIIDEVIKLRKQMREEYSKITPKKASDYRNNIILKWKDTINKLLNIDIRLALLSVKILGDIYLEFDDYEKAKSFYSYFKFLATNLELLEELMMAYESLGIVSKFLYKHQKAIAYFKKQIELSWILENINSELRAYDHIGIQYFYLGNKQRAKYYHLRFICGRYEKDTELKKRTKADFKEKNFNFFENDQYKNRYIDSETLSIKLKDLLNMFDCNKKLSLNEIDISRVPESVNTSNVSKSNITFNIISKSD